MNRMKHSLTSDNDFQCHRDEFCMLWARNNDCAVSIKGRTDNCKRDRDNAINTGFIKTRGYIQCQWIVCGYLRKNGVNPKDINTIIAEYLSDNGCIEFSISNDHNACMILFPSMKQVCIHFSKIFNLEKNCHHGCFEVACVNCYFCCGLVGIPHTDSNNDKNNNICKQTKQIQPNMKTIHQLLRNRENYDICGEVTCGLMLSGIKRSLLKYNNENENKNNFKEIEDVDVEIVDCHVIAMPSKSKSGQFTLWHCVKYHASGRKKHDLSNVTKDSKRRVTNDAFGFKNGDFIVLEYDKNDNTFCVKLHCGKEKTKENSNMKDDPIIITSSDYVKRRRDKLPIEMQKNKLVLKKGYDYVLACYIFGCNKRPSGMNNVYTFSGKHHNY